MAGLPGQNKGNKNAVGNKGSGTYNAKNRKKAATLKGLVINYATKQMKSGTKDDKDEIALKLLPVCVPRAIEMSGPDGGEIETSINFSSSDIRSLISYLPKNEQKKFYETITDLLAKAKVQRNRTKNT